MIYLLPVLAAILLPLLFIRLGLPLYINWQTEKNLLILNFEDKKVATAGGVILFLSLLLGYPFFPMLPFSLIFSPMLLFFYLFGVTFLGAIDDLWGEKECKGLRGHLKKFLRGEGVSTGIYKAAGGLLLGTFVSYRIYGGHWSFWFMGGLYLALLSNLFNLLDTRPGRVVKTFVLTSLPLILYFNFAWLLAPIWVGLAIYLPWEEKRLIMLGDAGAYLLGGFLGFASLFVLSFKVVILLNLFLLALHLFCEKYSLNSIMEKMFLRGGKSH